MYACHFHEMSNALKRCLYKYIYNMHVQSYIKVYMYMFFFIFYITAVVQLYGCDTGATCTKYIFILVLIFQYKENHLRFKVKGCFPLYSYPIYVFFFFIIYFSFQVHVFRTRLSRKIFLEYLG